jgi:protein kinase-like protein
LLNRSCREADVAEVAFGRYRLVALLGRGGMGEVWRAYDTAIDRIVALKLLPENFADDPVFQERFRREARAAAGLDEPHVVPIYDFGEIEGRLYVTMRLIKGRDLQTILTNGPLAPARAVAIIEQVAQAVHAAHRVGLVHRDIKPSNILLDANDFAYLIDFGIARAAGETGLTSTGSTIGTWSYMAPERFRSAVVDARSDIYALACVLYEALTGKPPFPGGSLEQVAVAHMLQPPPRPSRDQQGVPAALDDVIATGMAKSPEHRYASTVELARAAHAATTVPLTRPGPAAPAYLSAPNHLAADPIDAQATQFAPVRAAPHLRPPPGPPPGPPLQAEPTAKRRRWRPGVVIPALLATAAVIGGGVFAVVKLSSHQDSAATASATAPAAAPSNTGPFTGIYRADYGPSISFDGQPQQGATASTVTWGVRSVCRDTGCTATAARIGGDTVSVSPIVFDEVGGRWVSVSLSSDQCQNGAAEFWGVITLQPRPDGSFSGDRQTLSAKSCVEKRTVTFTRTGDVDITSLPDPAGQPPRVVSPGAALHGHYNLTTTYTNVGKPPDLLFAVNTECLRTGDRCISYFHEPNATETLVFDGAKWVRDEAGDSACSVGGTTHFKVAANYPLPQPPQDPITLLTGHGHTEATGSKCVGGDFDDKFVRTGD